MKERPTVIEGLRRRAHRAVTVPAQGAAIAFDLGALIERCADGEARLRADRPVRIVSILDTWWIA